MSGLCLFFRVDDVIEEAAAGLGAMAFEPKKERFVLASVSWGFLDNCNDTAASLSG
jgi:hypothetical protein